MSIQMNLLGSESSSFITATVMSVSEIGVGPTTVSMSFLSNGQQATTINGSTSILGNWINLPIKANEWEIRATLDSGVSPTTGTLNSWLSLASSRSWGLTRSSAGSSESVLTFEFRRAGDVSAETTISPNVLTAEVLDIF